jgi:putative oxidoreductase
MFMTAFLNVLRDLALLLARIGLGLAMVIHGWLRWQYPGQGVDKQIEYLNLFGTPYANVAAWSNIILELVGGIFLIAGFLTPIVGAAVVVQQALMIAYTNWFRGWDLLNPDGTYNGGYEYNVLIGLFALLFVVFGAGRISIDRLFRRPKRAETAEDDYAPSTGYPGRTRSNTATMAKSGV